MALSQKHRVALYEFLRPQLGDDVTEAFLAEFPAGDGDELVTKQFLRAELAELRAEMTGMHGELRAEMTGMHGELRAEMTGMYGELRAEVTGMYGELRTEMADLRTAMEEIHTRSMRTTLGALGLMTALITILN